jgi:hypothetical protein
LLSTKTENRRSEQVLPGVGTSGRRGGREGCGRYKHCVYMYVNRKMTPVETVPGIGREGTKKNDEGDEFNYNTL